MGQKDCPVATSWYKNIHTISPLHLKFKSSCPNGMKLLSFLGQKFPQDFPSSQLLCLIAGGCKSHCYSQLPNWEDNVHHLLALWHSDQTSAGMAKRENLLRVNQSYPFSCRVPTTRFNLEKECAARFVSRAPLLWLFKKICWSSDPQYLWMWLNLEIESLLRKSS